MTIKAMIAQLTEAGYRAGPPANLPDHARAIDARCVEEAECEQCGCQGLVYFPWHKGTSYRALAWCRLCLAAIEV